MFYVYILVFVGGKWKKNRKKLTNVSLYVCMSAGNSEMLVFISVFFSTVLWKIINFQNRGFESYWMVSFII